MALTAAVACAAPRMQVTPAIPPCRAEAGAAGGIQWISPDDAVERRMLASWCDTVGPPAFNQRTAPANAGGTFVVTWNVHGGAGNVPALLQSLREQERAAGRSAPNVILLLQEAIRIGAAPARVPDGSPVPDRIDSRRAPVADIMEVARLEDMNAVYVPSMRNGSEGSDGRPGAPEDRGNAILSTLPLSEAIAIELPYTAQRRVAVSARVDGMRVATVHLDTSGGQGRQAAALLDGLAAAGVNGPLLIGGDFNSSMRRRAVIRASGLEVRRVECGGITHKFFQLDHVLTSGLEVHECTRLDPFGSDHSPLKVGIR